MGPRPGPGPSTPPGTRARRRPHRSGRPSAQAARLARGPAVSALPAPRDTARRLARREVLPCLTALRLADPNALCLPRSYALAVHLSTLGLPVEVVVARQRSSIGGRFAFHAWAELYGEVLADIPGVRTGFTVLWRLGSEHVPRVQGVRSAV